MQHEIATDRMQEVERSKGVVLVVHGIIIILLPRTKRREIEATTSLCQLQYEPESQLSLRCAANELLMLPNFSMQTTHEQLRHRDASTLKVKFLDIDVLKTTQQRHHQRQTMEQKARTHTPSRTHAPAAPPSLKRNLKCIFSFDCNDSQTKAYNKAAMSNSTVRSLQCMATPSQPALMQPRRISTKKSCVWSHITPAKTSEPMVKSLLR